MMSEPEFLVLGAFALLSLADLRYRTAPGIAAVYLAALYLAATSDPLQAVSVALAVIWGHWRFLPGVLAWLDCRVVHAYDGGDHTIFVGEVEATGTHAIGAPLLYYNRQWRKLDAARPVQP